MLGCTHSRCGGICPALVYQYIRHGQGLYLSQRREAEASGKVARRGELKMTGTDWIFSFLALSGMLFAV